MDNMSMGVKEMLGISDMERAGHFGPLVPLFVSIRFAVGLR
jgi:hypothetical protein